MRRCLPHSFFCVFLSSHIYSIYWRVWVRVCIYNVKMKMCKRLVFLVFQTVFFSRWFYRNLFSCVRHSLCVNVLLSHTFFSVLFILFLSLCVCWRIIKTNMFQVREPMMWPQKWAKKMCTKKECSRSLWWVTTLEKEEENNT